MSDVLERKFGELTIRIDREHCISTGNCRVVAPELFVLDNDDICDFVTDGETLDRERLIEACEICPADALVLIDENGRQIVPSI